MADRTEDIRRAFIIGDTVPVFRCYLLLPLKVHWGRMPDCPNILVFWNQLALWNL